MAFPKGRPRPAGAGRKKGTPNKTTTDLREAILKAFDQLGGPSYLSRLAIDNSSAFASLLAKVLPARHEVDADVRVNSLAEFLRKQGEAK